MGINSGFKGLIYT